jgi:hypothetical protein
LRACPASSSAGTGSADITVCHFGHSLLPIVIAIGPGRAMGLVGQGLAAATIANRAARLLR